ncbi:MAG: TetR family transcriptional regulator [Actinobacteria bacterium]|nr:TetR family transcriptional regulator [Actinomycetota bacterium]MSZ93500.1 TetR family transcriptional regulator [Actinomycetota bacterium]
MSSTHGPETRSLEDLTVVSAVNTDATRSLGRRGEATRQKFLDAVEALLEEGTYRELTVVDIARHAGTSPATFYQYFSAAEDAVLALASATVDIAGPELARRIERSGWSDLHGWESSLGVADAFIALWDGHRSVLRLIDLATDEGDQRFRDVRTRLLGAPANAFVAVLRNRPDRQVVDPLADAGVLVSMLAHVSAHIEGLQSWGADGSELRRSMARVVFLTLTGQSPPGD